jgi:outer membrane protein assembly factor BamB
VLPGTVAMIGTQSNLEISVNPTLPATGLRPYPVVSVGGSITARPPIIDASSSSTGKNAVYIAGQDNFVYALDASTGQIIWFTNPTGLATNAFQGGVSVQVKAFSNGSFLQAQDLAVVGTRNAGDTAGNRIVAMNGNGGGLSWQVIGNSGTNPPMDMISSTPEISYTRNAIYVTSRSAGGNAQPSLWKIDSNTGAVLFTENLGDIDSSPTLTPFEEILFVGNNAGTLFAIDPVLGTTLASFTPSPVDGAIRGFPILLNTAPPFQVVFTTSTKVWGVQLSNSAIPTFSQLWSTPIASPSAPITLLGLGKVYVGSNDGKIHELDAVTGADNKQRIANTGQPGFVGDPTLDLLLNQVYVSTTDQRAYGFTFPF